MCNSRFGIQLMNMCISMVSQIMALYIESPHIKYEENVDRKIY